MAPIAGFECTIKSGDVDLGVTVVSITEGKAMLDCTVMGAGNRRTYRAGLYDDTLTFALYVDVPRTAGQTLLYNAHRNNTPIPLTFTRVLDGSGMTYSSMIVSLDQSASLDGLIPWNVTAKLAQGGTLTDVPPAS